MCWPLSTTPLRSSRRRARPPSMEAVSKTVTARPAPVSVTAAASPAQPPPITATRPSLIAGRRSIRPRGLPREPRLGERGERNALLEHAEAVALDLFEEPSINRGHDQSGPLRAPIDARERAKRAGVPRSGTCDLMRHQRGERGGRAPVEDIAGRHAEPIKLILWQIDPPAPRVLTNVADDVGKLEGDAEIARVVACGRVGVAEDLHRKQSDHTGHMMAVTLERREVEVAVLLEIHAHPVDDRLEMLLRQGQRSYRRLERE